MTNTSTSRPGEPTDPPPGGLLGALDGDPVVDAAVGDDALVRAMLEVEAAIARAAASAGLVSRDAAENVASTAAGLVVDPGELGRRATESGNPVVPLVAMLESAVPEPARSAVHVGATSQDVLDTALVLVAGRALEQIAERIRSAADAAAHLTVTHRNTPALARTLGQPAAPTTFGLRAAGWLTGLDRSANRLVAVRHSVLAVQLGGAAGTRAGYGGMGAEVAGAVATDLGLADPGRPWHTERSRVHELAFALHSVVTAGGKVAADVLHMSQAEVGEASEGAPGGSSAMPHKRNPVLSILIIAASRRAPALVSAVLAGGVHEQERATGSWHAEWQPLRELIRLAGGVAARTAALLEDLHIDEGAMRRNLYSAGPGILSEGLTALLRPHLGRERARDAVRRALESVPEGGPDFVAALRSAPDVADAFSMADLEVALDPADHVGEASRLVDDAIRAHGLIDHG